MNIVHPVCKGLTCVEFSVCMHLNCKIRQQSPSRQGILRKESFNTPLSYTCLIPYHKATNCNTSKESLFALL